MFGRVEPCVTSTRWSVGVNGVEMQYIQVVSRQLFLHPLIASVLAVRGGRNESEERRAGPR